MRYLPVILLIFMFISCKESSTDSSASNSPSLAIRLVNTGSGDFSIEGSPNGYYQFCYETDPCDDTAGGGGFGSTAFEGQQSIFVHSNPDKHAVGIQIYFHVTEGTGKIEILSGTSHGDDIFDDDYGFDIDEVVHTEGPASSGSDFKFSYGETN